MQHTKRRTHCKHGHEFTAKNTGLQRGGRFCRACACRRSAAFRAKPGWKYKDTRPRTTPPLNERFWRLVQQVPESGCWIWMGTLSPQGYGVFSLTKGQHRRAHRFAYTLNIGPIPHGLELDHLCRVRCCVNPDHLEAVTPDENKKRGYLARQRERERLCWNAIT
jgi:hypothetical protein